MSIVLYVSIIVCLILFPAHTAATAKHALELWGLDILPSLYPYMVFSRMLSEKLRNSRIKPGSLIAILGLLGGSPSGASLLSSYADRLRPHAFRALCALTGTISPMFFLGTAAIWIKDTDICLMLLASHWIGALAAALAVYTYDRGYPKSLQIPHPATVSQSKNPFALSADAILQVGGCIICFSVLAGLLNSIPWIHGITGYVLHAFLEISGGMHALCQSTLPVYSKYPLIAFFSGFAGCSILFQNYALLQQSGIQKAELFAYALLRGLFSGITMYALLSALSA